jgi:hypothetical protein
MADPNPDRDRALQQELRLSRKFSIADAIGQEAGNFMKGASPVPRLVQVKTEIAALLRDHIKDDAGALLAVLQNWITTDEQRVSRYLNAPVGAVQEALEAILKSPDTLYELVRQADAQWGKMYDERPYFQRPGQAPHPDDEYTHESVRQVLTDSLRELAIHFPPDGSY